MDKALAEKLPKPIELDDAELAAVAGGCFNFTNAFHNNFNSFNNLLNSFNNVLNSCNNLHTT